MARVDAQAVLTMLLEGGPYTTMLKKAAKDTEAAAKDIESSFSLMSLASLAAKATITAAIFTIGPAIAGLGLQALKLEPAREAFEDYAERAGFAADELLAKYRAAAQGMLADAELIKKANMAFLFVGESIAEDLIPVLEFVTKVSLATGESLDFLFSSIVKGIGRASTKLLDNAMLVARLTDIYKDYAAQVNKTVDELTGQERIQALANYVTEKGSRLAFELASRSGDLYAQVVALRTGFVNLAYELGRSVIPLFEALIPRISDAASSLRDWLIPELQAASAALREMLGISADVNISFKMQKARSEIKGLEEQLRELGDYVFLESKAFKEYEEKKVKVTRRYAKQIVAAGEDYGRQRIRRIEDFIRQKQNIRDEGAEDLLKIDEGITQDLADLWDDHHRAQAAAQSEFNARMRRESRDFLVSLQRLNEDHRLEMGELTRAFRSADTKEERDRIRERMRQTSDEHLIRKRRTAQDYKTQQKDAKGTFNRERSQRQKEAQARANQLARESAERRELRKRETKDRLADLREESKRVLARMDADHGVRIAKIRQREQEALQPLKDRLAEKSVLEEESWKDEKERLEDKRKVLLGLLVRYEQALARVEDASAWPETPEFTLVRFLNFLKDDFLPIMEDVRDSLIELTPIFSGIASGVEIATKPLRTFAAFMEREYPESWERAKKDIAKFTVLLILLNKVGIPLLMLLMGIGATLKGWAIGGIITAIAVLTKVTSIGLWILAAFEGITVALGVSLGVLLGAITLLVAEVGLLIWAIRHEEEVFAWLNETAEKLEGIFNRVRDAFSGTGIEIGEVDASMSSLLIPMGSIIRIIPTVIEKVGNLGRKLGDLKDKVLQALPRAFDEAWDKLKELIPKMVKWIGNNILDIIKAFAQLPFEIPRMITQLWQGLKEGFGSLFTKLVGRSIIPEGLDSIINTFSESYSAVLDSTAKFRTQLGKEFEALASPLSIDTVVRMETVPMASALPTRGYIPQPMLPRGDIHIHFNAPVYGERDFENKVKDMVKTARDEDVSQARTYSVAGR